MSVSRRLWIVYVAVIALVAMTVSFVVGLAQDIWFDEAYSILLSREPIGRLISLASVDAHPPLYYLYLKAWAGIFGYSEVSLRLSSVVPYGASIVGILLVLRQFFSRKITMLAGLMLLIAPFMMRYGYEIRMYSLAIAIGAWATYVLIKARDTGKRWLWAVYALLVAFGLYTVYMSAVFWVWHGTWMVVEQYKKTRTLIPPRTVWMSYIGAALLFMPWVPTVIDQLKHNVLPGAMSAVTLDQIIHVVSMLLAYVPGREVGAWVSLLILMTIISVVYLTVKLWGQLTPKMRSGYRLICLGWVMSLVFFALLSLPPQPPRFMERYMILAAMMFYLTIGLTVTLAMKYRDTRNVAAATACVVLILGVIGTYNMIERGNFNFQRMQRPYAGRVMEVMGGCSGTTVVVKSPYEYIDLSYYLSGCDVRFYQEYNPDYRGGYAILHDSPLGITALSQLPTERVVVIDAHEQMSTDTYVKKDQYPLENIVIQEYIRRNN